MSMDGMESSSMYTLCDHKENNYISTPYKENLVFLRQYLLRSTLAWIDHGFVEMSFKLAYYIKGPYALGDVIQPIEVSRLTRWEICIEILVGNWGII